MQTQSLGTLLLEKVKFIIISLVMLWGTLFAQADEAASITTKRAAAANLPEVIAYEKKVAQEYIYGFDTIHFFMTLEEVKAQITELKLAEGVEINEFDSDIYAYPQAIKQDFIYYSVNNNKHYAFSILPQNMEQFLSEIVAKRLPTRIYHLSKYYQNDFKSLTIPASVENGRPWELKFTFFRRDLNSASVFRLFAISIMYKDEAKQIGNFAEISSMLAERLRTRIYAKYGTPQFKRSIIAGERLELEKFYQTFARYYAVDNYAYNQTSTSGNYSLVVQLGLSYVQMGGKEGNFQISYVSADYLREIFQHFTTSQSQYEDFDLQAGKNINF